MASLSPVGAQAEGPLRREQLELVRVGGRRRGGGHAHLSEKDADRPAPFPAVLSQEQKLKALLYVLHLDDGRPVAN